MHDPESTPQDTRSLEADESYDSPLERLQLLGEDDAAIAAFLDEIDVRNPREGVMLGEMARTGPLAQPDCFEADHRRSV